MSNENDLTLQALTESIRVSLEQNEPVQGESVHMGMLCALTQRIMVISPLPERVKSLLVALSAECFDVFSLHDYNSGLLQSLQPELLVYDALPVVHGWEANTLQAGMELFSAAARHGVPVLVLMNESSQESFEQAQLEGAQRLLWPAKPEDALAIINRMLAGRPPGVMEQSEDVRLFKDIRMELRRMTVDQDGRRVDLTKTEYELLLHFINSDGSVLTRESLLQSVWGLDFFGGSNLVDAHIKSLRKKLKDSASAPRYIVTVRGAGYRLAD